MRRSLFLIIFLLSFTAAKLSAQSCFNIFAGNDTTISCLQSCLNLHASVPDVRTTDDYLAIPIPYQPYPYTNPGGILVDPLYLDDRFSPAIVLPFTFCFYGQTYTSCVVGTNGVVTFDISNASTENGYILGPTIPYAGGTPNNDGPYYPKASIMGPYHDIDPSSATPQQPDKKMEYIIVGNAPCRKFILNFYKIPYYNCGAALVTQQIVLYEGTGIIDVFLKDKPFACGGSTNGGTAILGVQNFNRDKAVWVPGRNNTVWSAFNEGWRFVPNGAASLLKRVELYKNNTLISTATTTALGNGLVDALFTNVCQSEDSMSYAVRAFYQQCDNPAIETEGSDTMIIYKTLNPLTINTLPAICPTSGNGQITVTNPVGANLEYSIDNGITWQSAPIFNRPAGSYTVIARVVGSNCTGSAPAVIGSSLPFSINGLVTDLKCKGVSTGQVTFNPIGNNPFDYSKDGGATYQSSNVFAGLAAGSYTFRVRNGLGCTQDTTLIVNEPATAITVSATSTIATCMGNDGTLTITAGGGTPGYEYSIDNGVTWQPGNVFIGLPGGNYNAIEVRDANGCITPTTGTITFLDTMRLELGPDSTICIGQSVTFAPQTNPQTNIFKWTAAPTLVQSEIDKDSIANATVTPLVSKKYYLTAKWGVCQRIDSMIITVLKKPIAFAGNDTIICAKTPAYLNGTAANFSGPLLYTWAPISPLLTFVSPDSSRAVALPDSTQLFIFNVKDNYGCSFSVFDTMKVFIDPPIPAFAGNDTNAVKGVPHQLFSSGGVSYVWSPAGPLNNPFIQKPLATLYNDTYFRVLVTDAIGCTATDDVFIKVYEGPRYYVPTAFSPNGDGLNDIFRPIPVGITSTDFFMVFNRYGEPMFQTREWLKGWDGKFKGKDAAMGVYTWILKGKDKDGKVVEMKGTVILLR